VMERRIAIAIAMAFPIARTAALMTPAAIDPRRYCHLVSASFDAGASNRRYP
jgi:hypothetical protein